MDPRWTQIGSEVATCAYAGDALCDCTGPLSCVSGRPCVPVALAGPRGQWFSLQVEERGRACDAGVDCQRVWTFEAEEVVRDFDRARDLPQAQWVLSFVLDPIIEGPEFRLAMADGIECPEPPPGFAASVTLELSTGSLTRDVTGCVTGSRVNNVFSRIFDSLRAH